MRSPGPNTGGRGANPGAEVSLPSLRAADLREARGICERAVAALARECGSPYRGILYGGFITTRDGVRLIEFNARFGDPECLNLLTLLDSDFVAVCRAIVEGELADVPIRFRGEASVCKYLVPQGYPAAPRKGDRVQLPAVLPAGTELFLSAVDMRDGELVATGSRTVAVVASAATLPAAEQLCEHAVLLVEGPFVHRQDIGTQAAIARRVEHMRALRGVGA